MRLIAEYLDLMEAEDAAMRLRREGILTHISSKHSFVISGYVTGAFQVGLWAVLDSQYEDARAYLADENHEVTSGLSEEELSRLETKASQNSYTVFNRFLLVTGMLVLLVALALLYFTRH